MRETLSDVVPDGTPPTPEIAKEERERGKLRRLATCFEISDNSEPESSRART